MFLVQEKKLSSLKAIDNPEAMKELSAFLELAVEMNKPLTMFSGYIDDAWHDLMKSPDLYNSFCEKIAKRPIEHIPSGNNNPIVDIEWVKEYEAKYGTLNPLWFADENGVVDSISYEAYKQTGKIQASWKCKPSTGSIGSIAE